MMSASGRTHTDQLDGVSSFSRSAHSSYSAFLYLIRTWPTERSVTAQHVHAVVDAVVSIRDQVAALTDLSMMEFSATTTAFGADAPGKDANCWISRHRVSSNSMTRSLPESSMELTHLPHRHGRYLHCPPGGAPPWCGRARTNAHLSLGAVACATPPAP